MIKGLIFVIVLAIMYWAIYFTQSPPDRTERSMRNMNVTLLETTVEIFRTSERRNPESLHELVSKEYIESLPDDGGIPFEYDPITGEVR